MTYVKTYLPTLKTHFVNLKRDAKDLPRDHQRLEVRGKLWSKTLYFFFLTRSYEAKKDPLVQFLSFSNFWQICIDMTQ